MRIDISVYFCEGALNPRHICVFLLIVPSWKKGNEDHYSPRKLPHYEKWNLSTTTTSNYEQDSWSDPQPIISYQKQPNSSGRRKEGFFWIMSLAQIKKKKKLGI